MVFENLEQRIIISAKIKAETSLHVGSGGKESSIGEADLPVIKDADNIPYIPGSSLKGKVRSEIERICRQKNLKICNPPAADKMCGSIETNFEEFCICCKIFGTAGRKLSYNSKVKFRDAHLSMSSEVVEIRSGNAIDRKTGTASRGGLFSSEGIPKGSEFSFEIVCENLKDYEIGHLKSGLDSFSDSSLGGLSSRGFGKINLDIEKIHIRSSGFYLGKEQETVLEGNDAKQWFDSKKDQIT